MGFLALLAIQVVLFVAAYLLTPRPKQKDSGPGRFTPPDSDEGVPIPMAWGTCRIPPRVVWFGDLETKKITKKVGSILGIGGTRVTVGYEYFAGMQTAVCWGPVDAVREVYFGDYRVTKAVQIPEYDLVEALKGNLDDVKVLIDQIDPPLPKAKVDAGVRFKIYLPYLFGGPDREGGVVGDFDFYFGSPTQGPNDYLAFFFGFDRTSNYRNLCYAVFRHFLWGRTPYLRPLGFVVDRFPNPLALASGREKVGYNAAVGGDANPANILYEILTDREMGLGLDPALIDTASFVAAGNTLATEGFGLSILLMDQAQAQDVLNDVLEQINGVLFSHPLGGKITLKLIRADYTVATLPKLTPQNSRDLQFSRGSWRETINEIRLTWTDKTRNFTPANAQAQNLASIQAMRETISETVQMHGITTEMNAQFAAERALRVTSVPLSKVHLVADRHVGVVAIGDVLAVEYPALGLDQLVVRVIRANYGKLEDGAIEIDGVEDVFDLDGVAYGLPTGTTNALCGLLSNEGTLTTVLPTQGNQRLLEVPKKWATDRVWALVGKSSPVDLLWKRDLSLQNLAFVADETAYGTFCPVGLLTESYGQQTAAQDEVGFAVMNSADLETVSGTDAAGLAAGSRLALLDDEIVAFRDFTVQADGSWHVVGVLRGLFDTVPADHFAGTPVYFLFDSHAVDAALQAVNPFTGVAVQVYRADLEGFQVTPSLASVVTRGRNLVPYPPGNVRLNGLDIEHWPTLVAGEDAVLTWSHRLYTSTAVVSQDDPTDYGLGSANFAIKVELLANGQMVQAHLGITTGTTTWAGGDLDTIRLLYPGQALTFRITPEDGLAGLSGTPRETPPFS